MRLKYKIILLSVLLAVLVPTVQIEAGDLTIPVNDVNYFVTSFFDHDIPDYTVNNNFIIHDGMQWTDGSASPENCTLGVNCYDGHNGVDFDGKENDDIISTADGIVREIFWNNCGGNTMRVRHPELGYSTLYAHFNNAVVGQGSTVDRFQHIAEMGETGSCAGGVHVHLGVADGDSLGNKRADPYGFSPLPNSPVQVDPCRTYSQNLCVDLGYLWTTNPPSMDLPPPPTLPTINVSGSISQDTTWEAGYVYVVQGSVTVEQGVTLTLEPGVIVKFSNTSAYLQNDGFLDAQGTLDDKIHFTSYKDDSVGGDSNGDGSNSSPAVNDWRQVVVSSGAVAHLTNAVVRYGGYIGCGPSICSIPGALSNQGGVLRLTSSLVSLNRHGIYLSQNGYAQVTDSLITENLASGIYVFENDYATLRVNNSTISNHESSGISASGPNLNISVTDSDISQNYYGITASATVNDLSIANTNFSDNEFGDAFISGSQSLDFINTGNTTSGLGANGFVILGSMLAEGQIWNSGVPYIIHLNNSVIIPPNVILTINPGVVVKFNTDSSYIDVSGRLLAQGTPQNKIYFTSYKDDAVGGDSNGDQSNSSPAPGDWRQIIINPGGTADFTDSMIRYGGKVSCGPNICTEPGTIYNNSGMVTFVSSVISHNLTGVYSKSMSTTTLVQSMANNNSTAISATNSNISVTNSTVSENDNGITITDTELNIIGSIFLNNLYRDASIFGNIDFVNYGNASLGVGKNGFFLSGEISDDQILNPGVPFVIGTVMVPISTTLRVNPGTILKFSTDESVVNVFGDFFAKGTLQYKIYFTSYKDDSVGGDSNGDGTNSRPAPGDYYGIRVQNSGSADIGYSVIRYGSYSGCGSPCLGALRVEEGQMTLSNLLITKNKYGIYRASGTINVTKSSIKDNTSYGIFHSGTGTTTVAQNNFWGHSSGPYHPTQNPNGQGDRVSDNVTFAPWLTKDPFPGGVGI